MKIYDISQTTDEVFNTMLISIFRHDTAVNSDVAIGDAVICNCLFNKLTHFVFWERTLFFTVCCHKYMNLIKQFRGFFTMS